ncbi:Fe(2+)/Mn(2+) transporter pcl1 [Luteimicrobium xylanilyticum]|uniref:Fe(2+)/Mn(2+) transporter pcl1 n=1 Tax=Luteimicrobium xylanilyticum TaxID=1133546 RepID=A0A5P9Q5N5_9MICO|nr:VIT1/CCC1 transporter family protein [Luteimicrobium xylanilyticum]QFU96566.1 Fe(2+)/Mn(2+) transporter pcl1 [Luteimicrobium xylanilyticum]
MDGTTTQDGRAPRRAWSVDAATLRAFVVDANDGIVATAGLLEGFAGAGASDSVLLLAASAATIAGSLSIGGARWAEEAAERDAQLVLAAEEAAQLAANPDDEIAELAAYWERKGLTPALALEVARQLSAKDALAAQLESEHGIASIPYVASTVRAGALAALSFLVGALVPLLVTTLVPGRIEAWAILAAVVLSLGLTSVVAWRSGHLSFPRVVTRALTVGVGTVLVGYVAGSFLL